jgi:hypothetical protein
MIEYTWNIIKLDCYPEKEGQPDVVFTVEYTVIGEDDGYKGSLLGSVVLNYVGDEPYTPYANLTLDQILSWVKAALGEDQISSIYNCISDQIQKLKTPSVVVLPLPWNK